jgi:hypothetical protein
MNNLRRIVVSSLNYEDGLVVRAEGLLSDTLRVLSMLAFSIVFATTKYIYVYDGVIESTKF